MRKDYICACGEISRLCEPVIVGDEDISQCDITILHYSQCVLVLYGLNRVTWEARLD